MQRNQALIFPFCCFKLNPGLPQLVILHLYKRIAYSNAVSFLYKDALNTAGCIGTDICLPKGFKCTTKPDRHGTFAYSCFHHFYNRNLTCRLCSCLTITAAGLKAYHEHQSHWTSSAETMH